MKKMPIALLLILALLTATAALADNTGIVMIAGPEGEMYSDDDYDDVDPSDFRPGEAFMIDGLGEVQFLGAKWCDKIGYHSFGNFKSGEEAEYLCLTLRILNTNYTPMNYLKKITNVVCDYGDGYRFRGWLRQLDEDGDKYAKALYGEDESYDIEPLYAGRYILCVTLPNLCVNSGEPLGVSFDIGDTEFTYIHCA